MRVSVITFGCKVNQYESEHMAELLESEGYVIVPPKAEADIYVINSCAVTNTAERKVEHEIRRLRRNHPESKIILVGCYPQLKPVKLQGVDLILGNSEKKELIKYLGKTGIFVDRSYWLRDGTIERASCGYSDRTRAYIKIEDGCDRKCTYCAIRFARGPKIRSKGIEESVAEFRELLGRGYLEIVITGVNLGRYGKDTSERLVDLLERIESIEGDFRYRLSSLNPEDVDERLLDFIENSEKLCHHLHLSLQSGSDSVLKRMGREYTMEDYSRIVERLRKIDPDFSITTDIIVGFPGETEKEFLETVSAVKRFEFSRVHVFRFSPRSGTMAARMPNRLPGDLIKERSEELIRVSKEVSKEYRRKSIGKIRKVLIERRYNGLARGYDCYYILHEFHTQRREGFETVEIKSVSEEGVVSKSVGFHRRQLDRG